MNDQIGPSAASSGRLLVLEITENKDAKVLRTVDVSSRKQISVALCHDWRESQVLPGHIVRVILTNPDCSYQPWDSFGLDDGMPLIVTQDSNFFIHHPDTLVTGTSVADSFHCLRKSVINARTPSGSAGNSAAGSEAALFGHMIHDMFQIILAEDSNTRDYSSPQNVSQTGGVDPETFFEAAEQVLFRHYESLYAAGVSDKHARLVLHKVIPDIMDWYALFMGSGNFLKTEGVDVRDGKHSRKVVVTEVHDIEELMWSPVLGLKGKVDASVKFRIDGADTGVGVFELKTGNSKGFSAVSHAAQVTLYNLLMSDRNNRFVNHGLLSYIRYQEALKSVRDDEEKGNLDCDKVKLQETMAHFDKGHKHKSIVSNRGEVVGLMMQRNRLAHHLRPESPIEDLPPLIKGRPESCAKCFSNDSCLVQHKLLENGTSKTVADGPGSDLFQEKAAHLTTNHAQYYRFWRGVLADEEEHASRRGKDIWASRGIQREVEGKCLANLMLSPYNSLQQSSPHALLTPGKRAEAAFVRHPLSEIKRSLTDTGISQGDYVIISAEKAVTPKPAFAKRSNATETWQCGLASGFIQSVTPTSVSVVIDRSLAAWVLHQGLEASEVFWRIDAEEMYKTHYTSKQTLENLFHREGTERLRELIVDGVAPEFKFYDKETGDGSGRSADIGKAFDLQLNSDQKQAVELSLRAKDYALILGMPGTGKTTTLAAVVLATASRGKTVLLCSHTNAAVDNLLRKLLEIGFKDFIRLGRKLSVIDSCVHPYHISKVCAPGKSTSQLEQELDVPRVVATTCLGINHPVLARRTKFDLVVVDEASQVLQPICIGPLQFAKGPFILVGDHYQLPPLQMANAERRVSNSTAQREPSLPDKKVVTLAEMVSVDQNAQNESLFRRLCISHPEAVVSLSKQYRMAADIMNLSNELVYSGSLSCGSDVVARRRLEVSIKGLRALSPWLKAVRNPSARLVFLETDHAQKENKCHDSLHKLRVDENNDRESEREALVVVTCVRALVEAGLKASDVTILSPYRAQVHLIRECLQRSPERNEICVRSTEVSTIDQYQGRDNKCIIVSFVRQGLKPVGPLLKDWRRINVAVTRAKEKLILIGSGRTLTNGGYFLEKLMTYLESRKLVHLVN